MVDGKTGRPRTIINIERAAKLRAEEGPNPPRFVKYRPKLVGASPYSPEDGHDTRFIRLTKFSPKWLRFRDRTAQLRDLLQISHSQNEFWGESEILR
jgi:hypothetical protein